MFIPWLMLLRNKKILFSALIVVYVAIGIISAKRGAIISILAFALTYYYSVYKQKNEKWSLLKILVILFIFVSTVVIIDSFANGSILNRFTEEEIMYGSGRTEMNISAIQIIQSMNSQQLVFGLGNPELQEIEFGGHNDWLTFMVYNGLIGVFFYALFFYFSVRTIIINKNHLISPIFSSLIVVMLLQSMFSTAFNPTIHPFFSMMFIGFVQAEYRKEEVRLSNEQ